MKTGLAFKVPERTDLETLRMHLEASYIGLVRHLAKKDVDINLRREDIDVEILVEDDMAVFRLALEYDEDGNILVQGE